MNDRRSRRSARIDIDEEVVLVTSDGHALQVRLRDVSRDGFGIEHDSEDLDIGEIVEIRTRRSAARAQIQWVRGSAAGGTFIDAADPE
jgi:hypothetical protein